MKKNIAVAMIVTIMISIFSFYPSQVNANPNVAVDSAILVDSSSGKILYQKNIDSLLKIASMSKMMSEYLILEAVNDGKISWDQSVPVSDLVREISHNRKLSNVYLRQDETYTVKELYESVAIYSANGATMALAELIAGSEAGFVKMMNDKAIELGLGEYNIDYKFVNSTGLPNHYLLGQHVEGTAENEENEMTARSTAKLAYHLVNNYPEVLDTASIEKKVFKEGTADQINMDNWNWMLPGLVYGFPDVDGLKTGHTNEAGYCFTGTAERNGVRLISVVMKAESIEERFSETKKLFEYGFNNFSIEEVIPAGYQLEGQESVGVVNGKEKEVAISTESALSMLIRKGEEELYVPTLMLEEEKLNEQGYLIAPFEKGEKVGTMSLTYQGEEDYEFLESNGRESAAVVTDAAVEKAGWFRMMTRAIGSFFSGIWSSVATLING